MAVDYSSNTIKTTGDITIYEGSAYPRLIYRYEIQFLIDFYTSAFVGREDYWDKVANLNASEKPGYLLIMAPPGYGKSAFMIDLIQRYESGGWDRATSPKLFYYFIRKQEGRDTSIAFLQAINSQLLETLHLPGGVPPDLFALRAQFSQLWPLILQMAKQREPVLLLIDGLDEMAREEITIANLLPTSLNSHVHIIVSSRPNPDPLEQVPAEHPFRNSEIVQLDVLNQDDIRALLQIHGSTAAFASSVAIRVFDLTKGEPLFVRFICQEVVEKGLPALNDLEDQPPANVQEYFRQQLKQLKALAESDLTWDILGLLTVTLGAITTDDLPEILGVPKRKASQALEPIQRFLLDETLLELIHIELRRVLREEFSKKEQETYLNKLLDWCRGFLARNWLDETPRYVVLHYTQHLEISKAPPSDFYELMSNEWARAWERIGRYSGFINDMNQVLIKARAEGLSGLSRQILAVLCISSARSVNALIDNQVVFESLRAGIISPDEAVFLAWQKKGLRERAECLAGILRESQKGSLSPGLALNIMNGILTTLRRISVSYEHIDALIKLAWQLPEDYLEPLITEAITSINQTTSHPLYEEHLRKLTQKFPLGQQNNILRKALAAARGLEDKGIRSLHLVELSQYLSDPERTVVLAEALAAARSMPAEDPAVSEYSTTTRSLSTVGSDGRLGMDPATIEFNQPEQSRSLVLIWVARQCSQTSRAILIPEILVSIRALHHNHLKAYALFKLAEIVPPTQQRFILSEARNAARAIPDKDVRAGVIGMIKSMSESGTGSIDPVMAPLVSTDQPTVFQPVVEIIVVKEASSVISASYSNEVLANVRAISDEEDRLPLLIALAEYLPASMRSQLQEWEKRQNAKPVQENKPENSISTRLGMEQLYHTTTLITELSQLPLVDRAPKIEQAIIAASQIDYPPDRARVFLSLAEHVADDKRVKLLHQSLDAARATEIQSTSLHRRSTTLQPELDGIPTMVRYEQTEGGVLNTRAVVLSEIVSYLPDNERASVIAEAFRAAEEITYPEFYASVLGKLAKHLPESERSASLLRALSIARDCLESSSRAETLQELAKDLPQSARAPIFHEVLTAIREIEDPEQARIALSRLITDIVDDHQTSIAAEILRDVEALADEGPRIEALSMLVKGLPTDRLVKALQLVRTMPNDPKSIEILSYAVEHWPTGPQIGKQLELDELSDTLEAYAIVERKQLLKALHALLPMIRRVGGPAVMRQLAQVIIDTARWWP